MTRASCKTPENCTAPPGRGPCRCKFTAETRAKMSAAKLGRKHSPEHNANISAGMKRAAKWGCIPAHLKAYAQKLRANGFRGKALRQAIEAAR